MVWGDLESTQFEVGLRSEAKLTGLQCPILITKNEQSAIRTALKNQGEKEENIILRASISEGFVSLIRLEETRITLQPGERQVIEWPIKGSDAAWGRVVLFRATAVHRFPFPHQADGACGVLVLPFSGFKGQQIVTFMMVTAVILIGIGLWLWGIGRRKILADDVPMRKLLFGMVTLLLMTILFGFLNNWVITMLLMMLMLIIFVSSFERFLGR
jgi:hypothetical protein